MIDESTTAVVVFSSKVPGICIFSGFWDLDQYSSTCFNYSKVCISDCLGPMIPCSSRSHNKVFLSSESVNFRRSGTC